MRIGLFFGSFNPIHTGHLIIASFIAERDDVEQVWFIVSPQNPLKHAANLLNEYHRLHLVHLATEEDTRFKVSDLEFKLPRPSYTIDTLTYIQEKYPQHTFSLIMGADSFQNLHKWKNYKLLMQNFDILVYKRPGFDVPEQNGKIHVVNAPLLEVSATMIREIIKKGGSIRYFVPEKVRLEIENSGYYK